MASISPLDNGKFRVSWYDESGVRHRRVLPKKEAKELYSRVCASEFFEMVGIKPAIGMNAQNMKNMTFSELADRYIKEHLIPNTRCPGNKSYIEVLKKKWGKHRLAHINKFEFRQWVRFALRHPINVMRGNTHLKVSSVKKLVRYAVRVFTWGMETDIINQNPLSNIMDDSLKKEFRRLTSRKKDILSSEEFWSLMNWVELPDMVRYPSIAAWCTGMRASEICNLLWSEIHGNRIELSADKTKEADAKTIFMERELFEILAKLEAERICDAGVHSQYVFRNNIGTQLSRHTLTKSWRLYCDKYADKTCNDKYRKVTFHSLRNSYRTRKGMEGFDPKVIAKNMGHHSAQMSDLYNVVDEQRQQELSGFTNDTLSELEKQISGLLHCANKKGISLAELQSEIRRLWRIKVLKNEG